MNFIKYILFLFSISFGFSQENLTHTVRKGETLYSISKKYNVSLSVLEQLNPAAKQGLAIHTILKISDKKERDELTEHEVAPKETLYSLSKKYNTSIEKLKEWNSTLKSEGLKVGQILKVSAKKNVSVPENVIEELPREIKENNAITECLQDIYHTVLPKETKYGISKKYKMSVAELEQLNPQIKNDLSVGTRLVLRASEKIVQEVQVEEVVAPQEIKPFTKEEIAKIETVIETASSKIGTKYKSGGTDTSGFDCSGLMFSSFKSIDLMLPRSSFEQAAVGVKIDKNLAQKGDLIFFATGGGSRISHVGLITEVSENDIKFIHSSTSSGVIISSLSESYYEKRFVQINHLLLE